MRQGTFTFKTLVWTGKWERNISFSIQRLNVLNRENTSVWEKNPYDYWALLFIVRYSYLFHQLYELISTSLGRFITNMNNEKYFSHYSINENQEWYQTHLNNRIEILWHKNISINVSKVCFFARIHMTQHGKEFATSFLR